MASIPFFDCLPNEIISHIHRRLDAKSRAMFKVARPNQRDITLDDSTFDSRLFIVENYIHKHCTAKVPRAIATFLKASAQNNDSDHWVLELCRRANVGISPTSFVADVYQLIHDIKGGCISKERVQLYNNPTFELDEENVRKGLFYIIAKHCTVECYELLHANDKIRDLITCETCDFGVFIFNLISYKNKVLLKYIISTHSHRMDSAKGYLYMPEIASIFLSTTGGSNAATFLECFTDIPLHILVENYKTAERDLNNVAYFLLRAAIAKRSTV
jgi:hypothetical protein